MRLRHFGLLAGLAVFPSSAAAAPVVEIGAGGRPTVRHDPYLTATAVTPPPAVARRAPLARLSSASHSPARGRKTKRRRKPTRTVAGELLRMERNGGISQSAYQGYVASWNGALAIEKRLRGNRKTELTSVTNMTQAIAAAKLLTPSRLPVLFLTVARNVQYWQTGPLLGYGQRVEFAGSQLVWQYYPGQGIQLQVLGTFGKADALYTAGPSQYPALRELLGEMIPLAAIRGGGLTWEYYFKFGAGTPPWTSAMSQGTALEALTRGYLSWGGAVPPPGAPNYLAVAEQALRILTVAPPTGVGVRTALGVRLVQYSFAGGRGDEVINAFLQALIGLYDYAQASGSATAATLFTQGNVEAQAELSQFDTGAWSLYQPGEEDSLDYHQLVIGFLQLLCQKTASPIYCITAQRFQTYTTTPPILSLASSRLPLKKAGKIRFRLSKISHVGIVVMNGSKTVLATSATFPYGLHSFTTRAQRHIGQLAVRMSATDLAGNFTHITGAITVTR